MNRIASKGDLPFLNSLSPDVTPDLLQRQVSDGRLRIITAGHERIGFLKFCVLWERLPFLEVILLRESMRRRGHGTGAVREWENEMRAQGFDVVLISTPSDEGAQHFWRKLGYVDCGAVSVLGKPSELFMQRELTRRSGSGSSTPDGPFVTRS